MSQVNENLSMNLFILNWSFQILLKLWGSLFLIKVDFFLPQTAQKHLSSLFSFVTLKLSFAVYFLQLVHYFSIVFIYIPQNFIFLLFISLYSFNALFTETNSSWLIYESIKDLKIRASIVFNLFFITTLLSCFLSF